jgi:hypothetical protein
LAPFIFPAAACGPVRPSGPPFPPPAAAIFGSGGACENKRRNMIIFADILSGEEVLSDAFDLFDLATGKKVVFNEVKRADIDAAVIKVPSRVC